tara:strand:- start:876 stop:1094 length:219 start_codon:yes stop_codon:yes gene_type:complete
MTKKRTQNKENYYYYFWSAVTLVVVAGQIYVGNGYRQMSQDLRDLTEVITIQTELEELRERERDRSTGGILY